MAPFTAQRIVHLEGPVEVPRLHAALVTAVTQHEALRLRILAAPGSEPRQIIDPEPRYDWEELDLTALPRDARPRALREHMQAAGVPDPKRGPVVRATLAALDDGRNGTLLLGLSMPALCADNAALRLVARQIAAAAGALGIARATAIAGAPANGSSRAATAGAPANGSGRTAAAGAAAAGPASFPASFPAFIEWQRECLARGGDSPGAAFWVSTRPAAQGALVLPLEQRTSADFSPATAAAIRLDPAATAALAGAAGGRVPLDAIVLAAWCALVARLTGRDEVDVAIVGDGRQTPELASIVGLLAHWLPLRAEVPLDTSIPEVARKLVATRRAALEWQRYFVWPIEGRHPLEGSGFPAIAFRWDEPDGTAEHDHVVFDRYKACLRGRIDGGALTLELDHDGAVLPPAAVARLGDQLVALLRQVAERPATTLGELALG